MFPEIDELMTYGIAMAERNVPTVAPGLWRTHRFPGEHACDFTLRIYKDWLPHMHRADIEHLDPVLARKLTNDKAYQGDLGGLQLPTLQEHHAAWAERNGIGKEAQHSARHRFLRRMGGVADRAYPSIGEKLGNTR